MLLKHKIKIYDLSQNLPTFNENKNYEDFLFAHEINEEDVPNTPEKTRVSIGGVVEEVNYGRRKY